MNVVAKIAFAGAAVVLAGQAAWCDSADELKAADRGWERVFAAKDLEASVAACAADGAVLAPNATIAKGREEIRRLLQGFFALPGFEISWHATEAVVAKSGELGYSSGTYEMHVNDASGEPAADRGKYVTIWKKEPGGSWRVLRDIFNSDSPAGH